MTDEITGAILVEMGQQVADVLHGYDPIGAFLYVEAGDMWQSDSIFKDLGNQVLFKFGNPELIDAIERLWEAAPSDKKWAGLAYTILDGSFDAEFSYPEDFDPDETKFDRRQRIVAAKFGDKPVDYSDPD